MSTSHPIRRIGVLTGGGDCPGLNAVIRAVIKTATSVYRLEVVGILDGFLGLIENRVRPLGFDDAANILTQGGTILGSSNKSNPGHYAVGVDAAGKPVFADVTDRVLAHVAEHRLDALVCIGGDGTMSSAACLTPHGVRVIGVPKTIDNDLMHTEVTFGFDTAVTVATEAIDRIRTTAASHSRVMLVETMGRNAGWIALTAGCAGGADVILIPEVPFDVEAVCRRCVERSKRGRAYTLIVVGEGAAPVGGRQVVERIVAASPEPNRLGGVSQVLARQIEDKTGLECRATILGHVQRGGTPTARDRVLATLFGHHAMTLLHEGCFNHMVAMQGGRLTHVPLEHVRDRQRTIPLDDPLLAACRATGAVFGEPGA